MAKRARIVLLAAGGLSNRAIAERVDLHYNQVGMGRARYAQLGWPGLEDEERPGRPCVYDHDDVLLLIKTVTEPPPDGASRWTMEAFAEAMAGHGVPISASQAWRICKGLDLKPWQVESWITSHDPDFWERAGDVCGLQPEPAGERRGGRWMRSRGCRPRAGSTPPDGGGVYKRLCEQRVHH